MDNTERDTHFLGFAMLLAQELHEQRLFKFTDVSEARILHQVQQIIAQRAYDLVFHALDNSQDEVYYDPSFLIAEYIPDLTEWPTPPQP